MNRFFEERWRLALLAICVFSLGVHITLLDGTFIQVDDYKQLLANEVIKNLTWHNFKEVAFTNFLNRNHGPMYISFMLNWAVTPHLWGFAIFNLCCLLAMNLAFFGFSGLFLKQRRWQLLATALFSVHSVHVDVVAWVSARCHLMGMIFFLLTFVAWRRHRVELGRWTRLAWYFTALLCAWLAVWNKNIFFSIGLFLFVYDFYARRRATIWMLVDKIPFVALGAIPIVVLKTSTHYLSYMDHSIMGSSVVHTLINDLSLLVQYLYSLVVPSTTYIWVDLYPVASLYDVSAGSGILAMRLTPLCNAGILAAVLLATIWLARHWRLRLPIFVIIFGSLAFAPVMNIPPKWVEFAFRYDMIPSAFYCVAVVAIGAAVWMRSGRVGKWIVAGLSAVLILGHAVQSTVQSRRWETQQRIYETCAVHFPDAKQCTVAVALYYLKAIGPQKAIETLDRVEELQSRANCLRPVKSAYHLGHIYHSLNDAERARFYFERALLRDSLRPGHRRVAKQLIEQLSKNTANSPRPKTP